MHALNAALTSDEDRCHTAAMIAFRNVGKLLKIRGVLVDVAVLERSALEPTVKVTTSAWGMASLRMPEELMAAKNVKLLLLTEIREELFARGAPIIGKRWECEARLEALYAAELLSGESETTVAAAPVSAASPRDKYAEKLSARKRASAIRPAESHDAAADVRPPPSASAGGWRLRAGAGELIQYLDLRGMRRALLPDASSLTDSAAHEHAGELTAQLQAQPWDFVVLATSATSLRETGDAAALHAVSRTLDVPLGSLLILTVEPRALGAARAVQAPTCFFAREVPGTPKRLPADAVATSMTEVRHCVEDFNGVTFRDSNLHISTKYGGG